MKNHQGGCETVNGFEALKILTNCDISITGLKSACEQFTSEFHNSPRYLLIDPHNYDVALACTLAIGWGMTVLSAPIINENSWAIVGKEGCIWSPGA